MRTAACALLLLGCTPTALDGRRFACDPALSREPGSDQCPGNFRCGLESYCHEVGNVDVRWRCESANDCEREWQCGVAENGLTRECHDPLKPEPFRCLTTADCATGWTCGLDDARLRRCHDSAAPRAWPCDVSTDCVGGWKCGLSERGLGECHDPSAPAEWRCESNADCLGGWQCGLDDRRDGRRCHDPAAPRAYACETAQDCVAGWHCGLTSNRVQRECHDPRAPAAFPCEKDTDCVGGWRCGLEGLCVDASLDALMTPPAFAADASVTSRPSQPATRLSTSPLLPTRALPTLAFVRAGRLQALRLQPDSRHLTFDLDDASGLSAFAAQGPRTAVYSTLSSFVATDDEYVYAAEPDAGLRVYRLLDDGGVTRALLQNPPPATTPVIPMAIQHFASGRAQNRVDVPWLLGFSSEPTGYFMLRGPNRGLSRAFDGLNPGSTAVLGMADVVLADGTQCTFVVDQRGLWVAQDVSLTTASRFAPVNSATFGNTQCFNGRSGLRVTGFELLDDDRAVVVAEPNDGGSPRVALWDLRALFTPRSGVVCSGGATPLSTCATNPLPFAVELGPCVPCPSGELQSVAGVEGPSGVELQTRCAVADGGVPVFYRLSAGGGGCRAQLEVGPSLLFDEPNPQEATHRGGGWLAYAGAQGQLWYGRRASATTSVTLDHAAAGAVRLAGAAEALFLSDRALATAAAGEGLLAAPLDAPTVASANHPTWVLTNQQVLSLDTATSLATGRLLAHGAVPATGLQLLVRARSNRGTTVAIVAAGREVLAAEVDESASSVPARLSSQLTASSALSSLAVGPPRDGGVYLEGYAVAGDTLVRIVADDQTRWRSEVVPLPAGPLPAEVWFSGGRARVGLSNGAVIGLPSRVELAEPVPGGSVSDYATLCGQDFALTPSGLHRLTLTPPRVTGAWASVALPSSFARAGLAGGRLVALPPVLSVFTRSGEAASFVIESCPP